MNEVHARRNGSKETTVSPTNGSPAGAEPRHETSSDSGDWPEPNASNLRDEKQVAAILARLVDAVERNNSIVADLSARVQNFERQLQSFNAVFNKTLTPLAEANRLLHATHADDEKILSVAMGLIQMIDRQSAEITEAEQGVLAFTTVEECREVDRLDATNQLARLGIEEMIIPRGMPVDLAIHDIERVRPSVHANKFGRIASVKKRGWRRRRDGQIVRAPLVEVWGPQAAVA
jgi:hypothetical protein